MSDKSSRWVAQIMTCRSDHELAWKLSFVCRESYEAWVSIRGDILTSVYMQFYESYNKQNTWIDQVAQLFDVSSIFSDDDHVPTFDDYMPKKELFPMPAEFKLTKSLDYRTPEEKRIFDSVKVVTTDEIDTMLTPTNYAQYAEKQIPKYGREYFEKKQIADDAQDFDQMWNHFGTNYWCILVLIESMNNMNFDQWMWLHDYVKMPITDEQITHYLDTLHLMKRPFLTTEITKLMQLQQFSTGILNRMLESGAFDCFNIVILANGGKLLTDYELIEYDPLPISYMDKVYEMAHRNINISPIILSFTLLYAPLTGDLRYITGASFGNANIPNNIIIAGMTYQPTLLEQLRIVLEEPEPNFRRILQETQNTLHMNCIISYDIKYSTLSKYITQLMVDPILGTIMGLWFSNSRPVPLNAQIMQNLFNTLWKMASIRNLPQLSVYTIVLSTGNIEFIKYLYNHPPHGG